MIRIIYLYLVVFLSFATVGHASELVMNVKRISWDELETMAIAAKPSLERQANEVGLPIKIYLHWSAGHYGDFYDAYHINIDADGGVYVSTNTDLAKKKGHTYMRNIGSVGVALSAGFNVTPKNLGQEPPTEAQIDSMAKTIAILSTSFRIPIDLKHVMTHGEAGDNRDKYFPPYESNNRPYGMYGPLHDSERWDLAILRNGDPWRSGGEELRMKALLELFYWQKAKRQAI